MKDYLKHISSNFRIHGNFLEAAPYGSGHINSTYKVTFNQAAVLNSYIFQKINTNIFKDPYALMSNISRVIEHQKKKLSSGIGGLRKTLDLVPANNGSFLYKDSNNEYWRAYLFIEDAVTYEIMKDAGAAYNVAKAFGEFQKLLVDLPGARLYETIVDFHNTPKRYTALEKAIEEDIGNRAKDVGKEIDFIISRKHLAGRLSVLYNKGEIQERICHYDTKLNNVMIDTKTNEGICVIDLDTVMPGFVAFDFGDMVRSATSPVAEDEKDVSKVTMQMHIFKALANGYLSTAGDFLNKAERETLPFGGLIITLENAVRFLMDHLQMDTYYRIHREGHNLDRCRTQIALVKSIEEQFDEMNKIVE